jgi:hypothetical protein
MSEKDDVKKSVRYTVRIPEGGANQDIGSCSNLQELLGLLNGYIKFNKNTTHIYIKKDGIEVKSFWDIAKTPGVYRMQIAPLLLKNPSVDVEVTMIET